MQKRATGGIRSLTSATSMGTRLPAAVVVVSLASLIGAIIVAVNTGRDLGQDLTDDRLRSIQTSGVRDVEAHMGSMGRTAQALASSPQAVVAVDEFAKAHRELLALPLNDLEEETIAVVSYHQEQYIEPLRELGQDVQQRDISTGNAASIYLQFHYAVNLGIVERPETIDDARDGSAWSEVHDAVHPGYRDVTKRLGLVDLFLIEPDDEYIVYSVRKRPGLGTSLQLGPRSGSVLASITDRVLDDPSVPVVMSDLAFYAPALTTPVGVVASPVMDDDRVAGVLVLMYDSAPITDILTADGEWDDAGFPPTGENFLVGADGTTRSEPRSFVEDPQSHLLASVEAGVLSDAQRAAIETSQTTVLVQPAVGETVNAALQGDDSVEKRETMIGDEAFSTVTAVAVDDLDWFVVSEAGVDVAEGEIDEFQELLVVGTATFIVALAFVAVAWASRIVHPIRAISERLAQGAAGAGPIDVPTRSPIEFHRLASSFESMSAIIDEQQTRLADARDERLELLRRMLPPGVADRVADGDVRSLEEVPQATVAVVVVLGLGALVRVGGGSSDRELIDELMAEIDELASRHGLERVKVLGDAFFAAVGHDRPFIDHAPRAVSFATDAQDAVRELGSGTPSGLDVSVGIHTGPVTVGMTGASRLLYDVWGATVSTAHHLARRARHGQILASGETRALLPETIELEPARLDDDDTVWSIGGAPVGSTS